MNGTDLGAPAEPPVDPFRILRAADTPGWSETVAPAPEFAAALRDRLQRGATLPEGVVMATATDHPATATPTIPESTVPRPGALPYLTVADGAAAIDWYVTHLGATLRGEPIMMDDGRVGHAELEMGGGLVYLADEFGDLGLRAPQPGQVSVSLMLPVPDTDTALAAASRGGASVTGEPREGHGARSATIVDPFGHRWMLTGPVTGVGETVEPIHVGDIVYMSLQTPDAARAARFYGAVLGWAYDPQTRQVTNVGHRLGISDAPGYAVGIYRVHAVADFDTARAAIIAAGGTAGEIAEVDRDQTRVVEAIDDQGVPFAIHVPDPGTPRPALHPRDAGAMSYLTLLTPDSARFRGFYSRAMGWDFTGGRVDDGWEVDDVHPQIGVAGGAEESKAVPMWNTSDIEAAVDQVRAAGGTVLDEPSQAPYGLTARCLDDQGVEFYLGQLY